MNEKFRTIGLDTEDKITEFIDYIDDLEDTEEIKSDVYGFFEEESSGYFIIFLGEDEELN